MSQSLMISIDSIAVFASGLAHHLHVGAYVSISGLVCVP